MYIGNTVPVFQYEPTANNFQPPRESLWVRDLIGKSNLDDTNYAGRKHYQKSQTALEGEEPAPIKQGQLPQKGSIQKQLSWVVKIRK